MNIPGAAEDWGGGGWGEVGAAMGRAGVGAWLELSGTAGVADDADATTWEEEDGVASHPMSSSTSMLDILDRFEEGCYLKKENNTSKYSTVMKILNNISLQ